MLLLLLILSCVSNMDNVRKKDYDITVKDALLEITEGDPKSFKLKIKRLEQELKEIKEELQILKEG